MTETAAAPPFDRDDREHIHQGFTTFNRASFILPNCAMPCASRRRPGVPAGGDGHGSKPEAATATSILTPQYEFMAR